MGSDRPGKPALIERLRTIAGRRHVLTRASRTSRYATGFRHGSGKVLAVVRPADLVELWRTLQACIAGDAVIILQAANTGLTGGSTPDGDYDRDVVLINTMRIKGIHPIDDGRQVVCLPGATLYELETLLAPIGREPHSVIGSSCIGASVFGGVCNNSGGALVQRGPAYTEMALYARVDEAGSLSLVNHLGIVLEGDEEAILRQVQHGRLDACAIAHDPARHASDHAYCDHVRQIDAPTPARFNADPTRLYEASGSAGKLALFAVRLDTFPKEERTRTFYIGTNSVADLARLRRDILRDCTHLPVAAEYIHREAFAVAAQYGKDTVIAIERLGTRRLPRLFAVKAGIDALARKTRLLPHALSDRLLQSAARLFGDHLPRRMRDFHARFEHHLILKIGAEGIDEARAYLEAHYPGADGDMFECTEAEAAKAFLHRFAVAGAAIRHLALHGDIAEDIIALDVALPRNEDSWFETLPPAIADEVVTKLYYGHFLCHVFHQDYVMRKGADCESLKQAMLAILDGRGAEYPAEHNVGYLYQAKPALADHYRALDPANRFNPGIGKTSRRAGWQD